MENDGSSGASATPTPSPSWPRCRPIRRKPPARVSRGRARTKNPAHPKASPRGSRDLSPAGFTAAFRKTRTRGVAGKKPPARGVAGRAAADAREIIRVAGKNGRSGCDTHSSFDNITTRKAARCRASRLRAMFALPNERESAQRHLCFARAMRSKDGAASLVFFVRRRDARRSMTQFAFARSIRQSNGDKRMAHFLPRFGLARRRGALSIRAFARVAGAFPSPQPRKFPSP